jgi:hypothetical protein
MNHELTQMAEVSTSHGTVDYVLRDESHNKRGDNREIRRIFSRVSQQRRSHPYTIW